MAKTTKPAKSTRAKRRASIPGQKLPRKLYSYVTKKQQRIDSIFARWVRQNAVDLNVAGNESNVLDSQNRLAKKKTNGRLKGSWTRQDTRANKSNNLRKLMDRSGLSRNDAKSAIADAHLVHFGADPFSK